MSLASSFLTDPIFSHHEVRSHFDDCSLVKAMVRVEVALSAVQADVGIVPAQSAVAIERSLRNIDVSPMLLAEGTRSAGVPIPALIKELRAQLEPEDASWLHYGATSQDIIDTALCLCFSAAFSSIDKALGQLISELEIHSCEHAKTILLARTRGQLATPITFGLRLAQWAQPLIALEAELPALRERALRVQFGGASGSRNVLNEHGADITTRLAHKLALSDSPPWHTDRSGLRGLSGWLSRLVTALAKIGHDFSIASRGEIGELRVSNGGASSTMPHKSNPVTAEALQSLVAMALACEAGLSASAVHAEERDGGMWPVEWLLMPSLFETTGAALDHASRLMETMVVETEAMQTRIASLPEVKAEAAVFALANVLGRIEASRIIEDALHRGESLTNTLARHSDLETDVTLSDDTFSQPAAAIAESIFSKRNTLNNS